MRRGETSGTSLSQRVRAGEKLRPPERSASEQRARLLGGEAWRDYCRALERTGEFLLEADVPRDERTRAEGFEYLLGVSALAVRQARELGDPEYPTFARIEDPWAKWGAENADNHYLQAHVRPDRRYRIRGERGSCATFLIEAKEGFMHMGDVENFATLTADQLEIAPDGRFEIVASAERHPGNWLPLDRKATQILIRQFFGDWEAEEPARFTIECLESEGLAPGPPSAESVARELDSAAHFVETTTRFWAEWLPRLREQHVPGELGPARAYAGGADDIRYGNDVFALEPGQALVIESEVPDARYWQYQLCSSWFVTLDYANRVNSINGTQAHVDPDGRFRVVIAHEDPGCPNWLDTGGAREGVVQYRYVWTKTTPQPRLDRVPYDRVFDHLPRGTPRIAPEQRRRQIAARQRAVARRTRV